MDTAKFLSDVFTVQLQLVEDGTSGKKLKVRGEFAQVDNPTANDRVYPRSIYMREVRRLEAAMRDRKVLGELDHPCLTTDDWRVLTVTAGWKPFREIVVGDKVWSRRDGKAVVSTVTGIVDEPYSGKAYRVRGRAIDATFTPAHKFLVEKRPDRNHAVDMLVPLSAIVADPGKYGHHAIPKTAVWTSESIEHFTIPGVEGCRINKCRNDVSKPLHIPVDVFAAFLGIYLAEGFCSADSVDNYDVVISQETPWIRALLRSEVLAKFPKGLEWREVSGGFALSDARLYSYLKPLGDAYTKYIPAEVKKLGAHALKELLYWFTLGDGRVVFSGASTRAASVEAEQTGKEVLAERIREGEAVPCTRQDVFSVSERLIADLHECLVRSGSSGTVSTIFPDRDYEFAGRTILAANKVPLYQLHFNRSSHVWLDPRFLKIEEVEHNGRIYCLSTTEGTFYMEREGKSFWTGNSDGKTLLSRASHLVTGLTVDDNGKVIGEAEALDTAKGKDLQALLRSNAKIGVSSRGFGSTKKNEAGKDVVQEDYHLVTFDFVADPAATSAYPDAFYESRERTMGDSAQLTEALAEQETRLRGEFAERVTEMLGNLKRELREEVRGECLSDPSVAGARAALEQVKHVLRPYILPEDVNAIVQQKDREIAKLRRDLADRDLQLSTLREDIDKQQAVTREIEYKYTMERSIGEDEDGELIRDLIGDVSVYESAEALSDRVERVKKELQERRAERDAAELRAKQLVEQQEREEAEKARREQEERDQAIEEALRETEVLRAAHEAELTQLREDKQELLDAVAQALEANKQQALLLYGERQLLGNPNALRIRSVLESSNLASEADVDRVIRDHTASRRVASSIDEVRDRVRRMSKGRTYSPQEEEVGRSRPARRNVIEENYNGLGVSLETLTKLATSD